MGSSFSFFSWLSPAPPTPGLGDLPEACAALVLAHLPPQDICKLATLNRAFRAACSADFVWDSKLPSNYTSILHQLLVAQHVVGKKQIYAALSRPTPFDGHNKKAWLDKNTGGLCISVSSKSLSITGIDDRRYWNHISTEESRFDTVAYLQQIWWLEVEGEVDFPFPAGTYTIFFRLQLGRTFKRFGRRLCNSEHVHGWDKKPVRFQLWTADGQRATTQSFLNEPGKWIDYPVGNFVVDKSSKSTKVKFSMTQIDCTHTKGGLCLDSVFICPTGPECRLSRS
uniref:F-box domain-containing protein n=1 Tax=Kalanchoe fedtschenkoi TaxID=63787 RepID=A0A7N0TVE7_KALFE